MNLVITTWLVHFRISNQTGEKGENSLRGAVGLIHVVAVHTRTSLPYWKSTTLGIRQSTTGWPILIACSFRTIAFFFVCHLKIKYFTYRGRSRIFGWGWRGGGVHKLEITGQTTGEVGGGGGGAMSF